MNSKARYFIPTLYYMMTPVFILLDYVLHINFRVAILDSYPLYKAIYYGFCVLCGAAMYVLPKYTSIAALVESTIVLTMTILGLFAPYIEFAKEESILDADLSYFNIPYIINIFLTGGIAYFTLKHSLRLLESAQD